MPLFRSEDSRGPLPPLPPNLPKTWDQVLLNEDFHDGLNGWHTHTSFYPPYLSDHAFGGSPNSLRLSTAEGAESTIGGANSIYKRLGETFSDGYMFFGGWFAFRGEEEEANPAQIALSIDHQAFDDTARSFSRLFLRRWVHTTAGAEKYSPRWGLKPDAIPTTPAANVYVDIPNATAAKYPAVAGKGAVAGWNVNHGDYWFAGLLVSCNTSDNETTVGIGRYWRAYLGRTVYDLSVLKTNSEVTENGENSHSGEGTKTGSGAENPQVAGAFTEAPNHASSFSGGLNVGLTINNRGEGAEGEASLFAGHLFAAHYPVGTEFPIGSEG